jgi:molybdate transport system substrate-binding protein
MRLFYILLYAIFIINFANAKNYGRVLAASNLQFVFSDIIKAFYDKYPNDSIHVQYGSSGYLANYISKGNEYDLFLSADMKYPKMVFDKGLAAASPKAYARGYVVLVAPRDISNICKDIRCLKDKSIEHIIIANTKTSPYGKASIMVLKKSGLYNKVRQKINYISDIGLVVDEVLWHKNAGFIPASALSLFKRKKIDIINIDTKLYHPIVQGYILSKNGKNNQNIIDFLNFLASKKGFEILKKYGYSPMNNFNK